jgi:hypothetical protein
MTTIRSLLLSCILSGGALLGVCAAAAQTVPGVLPGEWVEDAESGYFQVLQRDLPCTVNSLSATMRLRNPRRVGGFTPLIKLALNSAREGEPVEAARRTLTVVVDEQHFANNLVGYVTLGIGRNTLVDALAMPRRFHFGEEIPVTLNWRSDGVIFVNLGGNTLVRAIGQAPQTVHLVVSSATAEFRNIRTAWVPSAEFPTPKCPAARATN